MEVVATTMLMQVLSSIGLAVVSLIAVMALHTSCRYTAHERPPWMYVFTQWFYGGLYLRFYHRHRVVGLDNEPRSGGLLVVANHASQVDGVVLGCSLNRPVHIMVKQEAFLNWFTGWFLRSCLSFPVNREHPEPSTIKHAFGILKGNAALGVFPEGTRSPNGRVRAFKSGAIRLAIKTRVPILPVYMSNTHRIMPPGAWLPQPAQITVKVGAPLDTAKMLADGLSEDQIQSRVYDEVVRLGREVMGEDVADPVLPAHDEVVRGPLTGAPPADARTNGVS